MKYEDLITEYENKFNIPFDDIIRVVNAVSQVFPMIILGNLTKNTYSLIRNNDFLASDLEPCGCYDNMIDDGAENVHPNYQKVFFETFSRENIISNFKNGKNEVYAEIYQKNKSHKYNWVSIHVIRINDDNGDMMEICLCRTLDGIARTDIGSSK
jgi:hypothetical protein